MSSYEDTCLKCGASNQKQNPETTVVACGTCGYMHVEGIEEADN